MINQTENFLGFKITLVQLMILSPILLALIGYFGLVSQASILSKFFDIYIAVGCVAIVLLVRKVGVLGAHQKNFAVVWWGFTLGIALWVYGVIVILGGNWVTDATCSLAFVGNLICPGSGTTYASQLPSLDVYILVSMFYLSASKIFWSIVG